MKLNKYITAAVIVLAVAVIVGFGHVTRENLARTYVPYLNTNYSYQGDITAIGGGSVQRCSEICDITPGCVGFVFNSPGNGNCHFKNKTISTPSSDQVTYYHIDGTPPPGRKLPPDAQARADAKAKADADAKIKAREEAVAKAVADALAATPSTAATPASTAAPATTPAAATTAAAATGAATTAAAAAATGAATTAAPAAATGAATTAAPAATPAPAAASTDDDDDVTPAPDNTMMYVAIGMGAIVLMMGVFMIASRRSAAPVAAGRRRR